MSNTIKLKSPSSKIFLKVKTSASVGVDDESDIDIFQKQLQESMEEGYSEGYKTAQTELENNYNEKLLNKFNYFDNFADSINQKIKNFEQSFEHIVIETAIAIAEKIVLKEVKRESIINEVLSTSLKKVIGANSIIVKINPEDIKWIDKINNNFVKEELLNSVRFVEDDKVEIGGCVVESEIGNVDSRISTQLNEIRKYLEGSIVKE